MRKANNELIADFLGYTQPHPDYPNASYWYKENEEPLCLLMFDRDWNWLIKVVEKIQSICDEPEEIDNIKYSLWNTDIKSVYIYCIYFITEYNEFNQ